MTASAKDEGAGGWTASKAYHLCLMSVGYVVGETAHFLTTTTNRAVAQDLHYGDRACLLANASAKELNASCSSLEDETVCRSDPACRWDYNGMGESVRYYSRGLNFTTCL